LCMPRNSTHISLYSNAPSPTQIYTLSLHDALPISPLHNGEKYVSETIESVLSQTYANWELLIVDDCSTDRGVEIVTNYANRDSRDRKSTRLNSSHVKISYAVFCLKKKKENTTKIL